MSTCCAARLKEIRGDSEERAPRTHWESGIDDRGAGAGGTTVSGGDDLRNGRRECRRSSKSTDLADSSGHDDEGAGGGVTSGQD